MDKPLRTWAFDIDPNVHPYINQTNIPLIKDIWIKFDAEKKEEN